MYELLGDSGLLDDEEYHAKLVREALKRASGDEKQQYAKIQQRKSELSLRMQELHLAQEALNQKDKLNVPPEKPQPQSKKTDKALGLSSNRRQVKDAADYTANCKRYTEALKVYGGNSAAIYAERMNLMQELLMLKGLLDGLEEVEKWLLLSMAIRNQSSLLGFMQGDSVSDEK